MHHSNRCGLISCSAPLPSGKKYVAVEFLTKETIYFVVDVKSKGQELFEQVCNYLGLNDSELFGLALLTGGEYQFIDPTLKITKFAPKLWKSQHGYGLDNAGKPLLNLYLRVQYYVDCHLLINDKITRHLYYLQLLHNVITYSQPLSEERSFLLSAYALQANIGNFNPEKHKDKYFDPYEYFPSWIVKKLGEEYIIKNIPVMHRDNFSLSRGEAQVMYIKEASDSSAPHNLHFYKMHRKKTKNDANVWIGICAKGVEIYEESSNGLKNKLSTFLWCDIAKLYFEKKKFEIRSIGCVEERKFTYYASSEELAKSLLWLCRMTHQFHMVTQPKVKELTQLELGGHKPYRETYIYSDKVDKAWEKKQRDQQDDHMNLHCSVSRLKKCSSVNNSNEQRVSVISSTSSNTTSGIVSDRIQNFDESEDELDLEIENLAPLIHHSLTTTSTQDRKIESKIAQDSFSQHSERSEQSASTESGTGEQFPVCSDRRWSSLDKRVTPTSSMLSSSSYTSFTDSTHSSSSQLSAITVKANLISPRVGGSCCWQSCCSSLSSHHCNNGVHNSTRIGFNTSAATAPECLPCHCIEHSTIPSAVTPKNGISTLLPQEIEAILEKQLQQRKACCDNKCGKDMLLPSLVPSSLLKKETGSNTKLHYCKQFHAISTCCNKHCLEQSMTDRQQTSSLYSSAPVISPTSHIFGADASRNCMPSIKCRSLPFHSLVYPGTSSHCHIRNATKIGVSSLTRGHRIPLSIFGNSKAPMTMAASEPNLCCPNIWPDCHSRIAMNSRNVYHSGSCSSVQNASYEDVSHPVYHHRSCSSNVNSLHSTNSSSLSGIDDADDDDPTVDFNNFPCIPPPLAYRTTIEKENVETIASASDDVVTDPYQQASLAQKTPNSYFSKSLESLPSFIDSKQLTSKDMNRRTQRELTGRTKSSSSIVRTASHSSEILDIQKLRQKSRDMDLPLISALCNDRSLLMLPKTVPTCSRQRHIGKDFRRFSCSYINPCPSENFKNIMEIGRAPSGSQSRPISWHLESADCMWLKEFPQYNTLPSIQSDGNASTVLPDLHSNNIYGSCHFNDLPQHLFETEHPHMLCCQHSSTVLASCNTSEPECNMRDHTGCLQQYETDVPSMPKQFLPINLSNFTQEDIPSGLYVKEQIA